jgi:hypothetical protein
MHLYSFLTLLTAAFAGSVMGSFLLLSLIYKPLISIQLNDDQKLFIYRRFYRLNIALCLSGGLIAALLKYQQAAFLLAILAASYVFCTAHILRGITLHLYTKNKSESLRALKSLTLLQNLIHFMQFMGAAYVIYILNITN